MVVVRVEVEPEVAAQEAVGRGAAGKEAGCGTPTSQQGRGSWGW